MARERSAYGFRIAPAAAGSGRGGSTYLRNSGFLAGAPGAASSALANLALPSPLDEALPGAAPSVPTLSNVSPELRTQQELENLQRDLESLNQGLVNQNYYVRNRLQGDPTLVFQGLYNLYSMGWDSTVGWAFTGSKGITCEDYVELTFNDVKTTVSKQFPGAKVQKWLFEEKSTQSPAGFWDRADGVNEENHNVVKLTLPDGTEWGIDFQQHNVSSSKPILRPWKELKQEWVNYLGGNEFVEGPV